MKKIEVTPSTGIVLDVLTMQHVLQFYLLVGDSEDDVVGNLTLRRVRIRDFVADTAYDSTTPVAAMAAEGNLVMENVVLDGLTHLPGNRCAFVAQMAGDSYANLRFVTAGLQGDDKFCIEPVDPAGTRKVDIVD